jgi:type VI secretion system protein ImpA
MAEIDFPALTAPVSDDAPCGLDLEQRDDPDFMQFMARADGLLPSSFFAFKRADIDFPAEYAAAGKLLAETRDLRLLTLLAKLHLLDRDLKGFASGLATIRELLTERWDSVHPRGEDGDYGLRMAVLQSLDDMSPVVLPLQHMPLAQSRQHGAISYRTHLLATKAISPREEESVLDPPAVEAAFMQTDLPALIRTRDELRTVVESLQGIRAVSIERSSFDQAVTFDRLLPLATGALALVDGIVTKRDPAAAPSLGIAGQVRDLIANAFGREPAAEAAPPPVATAPSEAVGPLADAAAAAAALGGAAAYFSASEPSSPVLLLVRQAQQLKGKSFFEVMQILVPNRAEAARIEIGPDRAFGLPLERLSQLSENGSGSAEAPGEESSWSSWGSEESDGTSDEGTRSEEGGSAAADGEGATYAGKRFAPGTRAEALGLIREVGLFFRRVEPSSPIPLLLDRALALADRDFLSLLKDVLPPEAEPDAEQYGQGD